MNATRLRNTFMLRDGEEMPLARPERRLRGKSPRFFFFLARHFQRCSPTDFCGTVDPKTLPHSVEVNSKLWSLETCVRGASHQSIREMGTFTTANRIITATPVAGSSSGASSNTALREDKRTLIARLLLERISLRGICRAVEVQ